MALRPATDEDWAAVHGAQAPAEWFGIVSDRGWVIEGMGSVHRSADGRWWIGFRRCVPGKLKTAHQQARRLLAEADARGVRVNAVPDPAFDGAEMWIARLGFARTDETMEGLHVWTR